MTSLNSQKPRAAQSSGLFVKTIAIALAVILVFNFVFLIQRKISASLFWLVIAFCAAMAWWGVPYIKKRQ
ncbi:hypothetical protein HZB03_00095 [Candidatus Woesearchaeota archaeon]|nr:hypothetical protein [Candidatus Woesearchaeota archaeon]